MTSLWPTDTVPAFPDEDADGLVGSLVASGVELSTEDNDITFNGPASALGESAVLALRQNKPAIVAILQRNLARGVVKLGPASWEQRRMEWRCRADRNPASFNVCMRLDLRGPTNPSFLGRFASALVRRYEILRTHFAWYGEHLLQEVMAPPRSVLQVLPQEVLAGASEKEIEDWCARRGGAAFDLAAEAPARWCYAQVAFDRAVLLLTLHHIACDGWSIDRLLGEFAELCRSNGQSVATASPVPDVATPIGFARWELEWLQGERAAGAGAFWSEEFRMAVLAPELTCWGGSPAPGRDAGCVVRTISAKATARAADAARSHAVSEFSLYFAAFAMLLAEETVGRDCAVVIAVLNRGRQEHEEVVGLCRNAVPIRCSVRAGDTIDIVARRIGERVERALEFQWCPLGLIATWLDAPESVDIRRLPVTFGFSGPVKNFLECGEFSATVHDVFLGAARAEFSLFVRYRGEQAEAVFEYSRTRMRFKDASLLADKYVRLLAVEVERTAPARR
ncbi:MAG: hypothetical protein JNL18_18645 [Planctomycetaceae bacterium]|nr:hypothetical protein [Planctomycetaceae bacterium]